MIGMSNGQIGSDNTFNSSDKTHEMTFRAAEVINAGDLVRVVSREGPIEWTVNGGDNDSSCVYFGSMAQPFTPKKTSKVYVAFNMATDAWESNTNVYATRWDASLSNVKWTGSSGLTGSDGSTIPTVANANTQLSAIPSYSWGKPVDIGDGYWLIPGQGSGSTTTGKDGVSYTQASQILLVYVDPDTGFAKRVDADYTWGANTYCYSGKPVICPINETEYVMVFEAYRNSTWQILARYFTVEKAENLDVELSAITGTVTFKNDVLLLNSFSTYRVFLGHCCWFVNPDLRRVVVLTTTEDWATYSYFIIEVFEDGKLHADPVRAVVGVKSKAMTSLDPWDSVASLRPVMDYYNNFNVYHVIPNGNHFLNVCPYYYADFKIDWDNNYALTYTIRPIVNNLPQTPTILAYRLNTNYYTRDWDIATQYWANSMCRDTATAASSRAPWLWPTSNNRFLMCCATYVSGQAQGANTVNNWRTYVTSFVDFDEAHSRLQRNTRYSYCGAWANGTTWPEANYTRPFMFTTTANTKDGDMMQFKMTRWVGTWLVNGMYSYINTPLSESMKELSAFRADSTSSLGREDGEDAAGGYQLNHTIFTGVALNTAYDGESVTIQTFERIED